MDSRTSTLQNPPDQYLILQSILECILRLEMLDHRIDMLERRLDASDHGVREAMQEIRSVKNLVCNYRSGFTMEHSVGRDGTVDSQAGVNDLNAITSSGSSHDSQIMLQPAASHGTSSGVIGSLSGGTTGSLPHGARSFPITVKHSGGRDNIVDSQAGLNSLNEVSYGVTGSMPEGTEGLSLNGTRGFANNVTHQGFPASYYMDVTESSSEGADLLDVDDTSDPVCEPAAQPAAQQLDSVAQISQARVKVKCPKVKCPWDKCPKFINKNDLTRHINEVHEKKIVAVCPRCKREFTRTNVMTHHACPL